MWRSNEAGKADNSCCWREQQICGRLSCAKERKTIEAFTLDVESCQPQLPIIQRKMSRRAGQWQCMCDELRVICQRIGKFFLAQTINRCSGCRAYAVTPTWVCLVTRSPTSRVQSSSRVQRQLQLYADLGSIQLVRAIWIVPKMLADPGLQAQTCGFAAAFTAHRISTAYAIPKSPSQPALLKMCLHGLMQA